MELPFKLPCPGCGKILKVVQPPPLKVRCPGCTAKVAVAANGQATIMREVPAFPPPPSAGGGRNPVLVALLIVLLLGALGGGGWWLYKKLTEGTGGTGPVVHLPADKGKKDGDEPKVDVPKVDVPKVDPPKVDSPKLDVPPPPRKGDTLADAKNEPVPGVELMLAKAGAGYVEYPAKQTIVIKGVLAPPGLDLAKVDQAVERGLAYLRSARNEKDQVGYQALIGWTLLACGVPARDPDVQALAELVRGRAANTTLTYDTSVSVWFLDKLGADEDRELIRTLGLRLLAGQKGQAGWGYHCPQLSDDQKDAFVRFLEGKGGAEGKGDLSFLARAQLVGPASDVPIYQDNSNTQFAILALWAAQKYGVPVERALGLVEQRFRMSQQPSGAWGYSWDKVAGTTVSNPDSMTCAGLLGVAVGRGRELGKMAPRKDPEKKDGPADPAIEKALGYLAKRLVSMGAGLSPEAATLRREIVQTAGKMQEALLDPARRDAINGKMKKLREEWAKAAPGVPFPASDSSLTPGPMPMPIKVVPGMPPPLPPVGLPGVPGPGSSSPDKFLGADAGGDLYFLWSLERMAVVYDLRTIGKTDWYAWGANQILGVQHVNGSWTSGHGALADTCFALLFLRRANVAQDLTVVLQNLSVTKNAGERGGYQGQGPSVGTVKGLQ